MSDFSEQFCVVTLYRHKITTKLSAIPSCLVTVQEGWLTIVQAPNNQLLRVPVVDTRLEVGKGVGVYVWIDDEKLLIDFASVHTAELSRSGVWGKVSTAFLGRGTIKTIKVSNGLRSEFIQAMQSEGAQAPVDLAP